MPFIFSFAIVTLAVAGGQPAVTTTGQQEPDTIPVNAADVETRAQEIFRNVMSPYCPGLLLANCPSRQAALLQDSIRNALREGASPEEIEGHLLAVYGDEVRPAPEFRGFGIWAWIVPGLFFVGGSALVGGWVIRRARRAAPHGPPSDATVDDESDAELEERLERELANLSDR